jgi:hypothetical protein
VAISTWKDEAPITSYVANRRSESIDENQLAKTGVAVEKLFWACFRGKIGL